MKTIQNSIVAVCIALGLAISGSALAQQQQRDAIKPTSKSRPKPAADFCDEFGAGFVRAPGTDTCVKVGGSLGFGTGVSR